MVRARLLLPAAAALSLFVWAGSGSSQPPAPPATPLGAASGTSHAGAGVFASAQACSEALAAGRRLPRRAGTARFASWNLQWFPDGKPGRSRTAPDLTWLACALWWLDADVVAVQEVKQTPHAQAALQQLLLELNRIARARYTVRLDDCGSKVPQHVGLLWNEARVTASDVATLAALNPSGDACSNQWRPGLAARLRFPGGLDLLAVSGHFKSKADARSVALRRASFSALAGVLRESEAKYGDGDLLLLGDLNTMGCEACSPPLSAQEELAAAQALLKRGDLRLVPADAPGSHFHDGRPSLLDHAVAWRGMRELDPAARTHVAGACATGRAPPKTRQGRRALSDHCPIVLDLTDRDLD